MTRRTIMLDPGRARGGMPGLGVAGWNRRQAPRSTGPDGAQQLRQPELDADPSARRKHCAARPLLHREDRRHRAEVGFWLPGDDGNYVGIEVGADAATAINLDDFMIFNNAPAKAQKFFRQLFYNTRARVCPRTCARG